MIPQESIDQMPVMTTLNERINRWCKEYLPNNPKSTEDFHMDVVGENFNLMEDMVSTHFDGDPRSEQMAGNSTTPTMWVSRVGAKDYIDPRDTDVRFFGEHEDNPQEGMFQAGIHRINLLAIAINKSMRERERVNYSALTRTVIGFPLHRACTQFAPTSRWNITVEENNDGGLFISVERVCMYYLWGHWSKNMAGGRESAMAKPPAVQETRTWSLPNPRKQR